MSRTFLTAEIFATKLGSRIMLSSARSNMQEIQVACLLQRQVEVRFFETDNHPKHLKTEKPYYFTPKLVTEQDVRRQS